MFVNTLSSSICVTVYNDKSNFAIHVTTCVTHTTVTYAHTLSIIKKNTQKYKVVNKNKAQNNVKCYTKIRVYFSF